MTGLTNHYPHQVQERDLMAIYQLVTEVKDRTDAAVKAKAKF
jgi:hypothetical protein